ncbi:BlaI/MecI/CopY family transcriptional regulator [Streptomyces rubiginosohelvolus]|uniref:CopY family transcriptional regulator n=1 Tax=Streptomyces globisporus C-1027 TaxID=1172567 RepID=A0A0U3LRA0_STRGL|nr:MULTISPECIES: BlaI/MecI/CopY family transcriptional regulator [Streptomyces]ALU92179.1 CopY family transcriptional regulator [Streptomyces globisporus C-1027]MBK3545751.1 BlaI/MecI/CopY family transcriptional regulator [Streptomyces sp. MBT60]MCT6780867.1 BlaI/MecI/CopY family transcriptional regulator [Streptomyces sp. CS-7]MZG04654.1 BlaI/MecI/CopY family transcriptional regulator [Streptomyces sp. SID5614]OKJ24873.1 CopY family transcriptional regulator [Streptomyces sp. CB02130]
MRRLGELEAEIMDCLWTWGRPATVREIVDDINRRRPSAYTTVMTVATILYDKGWLTRRKQGQAWLYTPVRSREAYSAALMEDALGASRDRSAALVHFVERMTDEEVAALREALRATGRDGEL